MVYGISNKSIGTPTENGVQENLEVLDKIIGTVTGRETWFHEQK